jgi:hypothetical protein
MQRRTLFDNRPAIVAVIGHPAGAAWYLAGEDESGMLDMEWWRRQPPADWDQVLNADGLESDSTRQKSRSSG